MRITLLTPQSNSCLAGNQTTAERWQAHLLALGHAARVVHQLDAAPCDHLIALHAYKSAGAIADWKSRPGARPLTLMLTGTDLYRDQQQHPQICQQAMALADRLVGLHARVQHALPASLHAKLHIVRQSSPWLEEYLAAGVPPRADQDQGVFRVLVSGHLREEKDPLRAALAVRELPATSRLKVVQAGQAHTPAWAAQAEAEMHGNPRYQWLGEVKRSALFATMQAARVLVLSSRMEGGANVISECITLGLPVIASCIDGNTGLLGEDYPALFEVANTAALRALLLRAESDPAWLLQLRQTLDTLQPAFSSAAERSAIAQLFPCDQPA